MLGRQCCFKNAKTSRYYSNHKTGAQLLKFFLSFVFVLFRFIYFVVVACRTEHVQNMLDIQ